MFKDLKENINMIRNGRFKKKKKNQMKLYRGKIHYLKWKFYWLGLTAY